MPKKAAAPQKKLQEQPNNPLHGITLEKLLCVLREHYSWKELNKKVELNCFFSHPSIKSSLTFLRKNEWARKQVEEIYIELMTRLKAAPDSQDQEISNPTRIQEK